MTSEHDSDEREIETLRAHWRGARERADGGRHCPDDGVLFDAANADLDPSRVREITQHVARCGACAESWRVATELVRARPDVRTLRPAGSNRTMASVWGMAAAAAVSLALGLTWLMPANSPLPGGPGAGDVLRGDSEFGIEIRTGDRVRMPRQSVALDWTPLDNARDYLVVVRDAEMNEIFADLVETPPLTLPPERLEELEPDATLYWYVRAMLESGEQPRSETRTVIVEG